MPTYNFKPFSKENYDKYSPLENVLIERIKIKGCNLIRNPIETDIDILVCNKDENVIGALECESHAKHWNYGSLPFRTCHFLFRKEKYMGENNFYIMLSAGARNALMIRFPELKKYEVKKIDNESMEKEPMWDVPVEKCIHGWKNINKHLNEWFERKI